MAFKPSKAYLEAAERRAEKIRRDHLRNRYRMKAIRPVQQHYAVMHEHAGLNRRECDEAYDKWFKASATWNEISGRAEKLWPEDLDRPCHGDSGAVGEMLVDLIDR